MKSGPKMINFSIGTNLSVRRTDTGLLVPIESVRYVFKDRRTVPIDNRYPEAYRSRADRSRGGEGNTRMAKAQQTLDMDGDD